MSFTKSSLVASDNATLRATLNPGVFVAPAAGFVLGLYVATHISLSPDEPDVSATCLRSLVALFTLVCLWGLLRTMGAFLTTTFAVTNGRIIGHYGLIHPYTLDVLLRTVRSVEVRQSLAGRLLGYGTLVVTCSNGFPHLFRGVMSPRLLSAAIQDRIAGTGDG